MPEKCYYKNSLLSSYRNVKIFYNTVHNPNTLIIPEETEKSRYKSLVISIKISNLYFILNYLLESSSSKMYFYAISQIREYADKYIFTIFVRVLV